MSAESNVFAPRPTSSLVLSDTADPLQAKFFFVRALLKSCFICKRLAHDSEAARRVQGTYPQARTAESENTLEEVPNQRAFDSDGSSLHDRKLACWLASKICEGTRRRRYRGGILSRRTATARISAGRFLSAASPSASSSAELSDSDQDSLLSSGFSSALTFPFDVKLCSYSRPLVLTSCRDAVSLARCLTASPEASPSRKTRERLLCLHEGEELNCECRP